MKFTQWSHVSRKLNLPYPPLLKGGQGGLQGFTLIEMVITIVVLSIASAVGLQFLVHGARIYTISVNQKTLFEEGKLALERMCRDIRDAKVITSPALGGSGNLISMTRTNGTVQDSMNETIAFQLNGSTLEKVKTTPAVTSAMAGNVSAFTVTRGADNEIALVLTLSLSSGENVTLQTKVYPRNSGYKNYSPNWKEEISP